MHSSVMRTDHCSGRHYMSVAGGLHPEGSPSREGLHQRGTLPPLNRQTPLKTLPSLAVGNDIGVVVADGWCKRTLTCLCIGEVEIKRAETE